MTALAPLPYAPTFAPIVDRVADLCPRAQPSPDDWAEKYVQLPEQVTADPGLFRLTRTPYLREPLRLFADPEVEKITLVWATQLGKTLLDQILLAYVADVDPSPCGLFGPNLSTVRKFRDKFQLLCFESPRLKAIAPREREWNDIAIEFLEMICYLGYAGSTQSLSGETCRYIFKFELDRWRDWEQQGSSSSKADERKKNWTDWKIFQESTPTDESSEICAEYELSNKCTYQLPCPRCGHFQELRFWPHKEGPFQGRGQVRGLKDERDNWLSVDEVHKSAWYECEANGCRIESWQKPAMLARAWWVPKGAFINARGELDGTAERSKRHSGLRLSSLASYKLGFGDVAAEFLERRDDEIKFQVFKNDWLALQHFRKRPQPKYQRIGHRLASGHKRGYVPPQAYFLTCAADVQADHLRWGVRAWGAGKTSWLVDWGTIHQRRSHETGDLVANSDLEAFYADVLPRVFPIYGGQTSAAGHTALRIFRAGVDSQHRTWDVFQWWSAHKGEMGERLRVLAGDASVPAGELYRMTIVEKNSRTGKPYPGGMRRWGIAVDQYKDDLRARWDADLGQPGAWWLYDGILLDGEDYLRQICSETKQEVVKKLTGKKSLVWVVGDSGAGNHFWDIEIYQSALADMAVEVQGHPDWSDLARRAAVPVRANVPPPPKPTITAPGGRPFVARRDT